uniref:ANK_REP_REGION domain-containing protein n=1 Tax=Caenorhabditis japonica TaxID=281687 RepID=A0A8R1HGR0_CAEJA
MTELDLTDIDGRHVKESTPRDTHSEQRPAPLHHPLQHQQQQQQPQRGGGGVSSLDTTTMSTSSKRSLHSSRLTLSDSKDFFKTVGYRWIRAVRLGDATTVKKMLEEKPELVHYAPMYGPLALHIATSRADRSIIVLLTAKGADIDARDTAGYTSLQLAIQRGNQSLAHFLISQGANLELCDPDGLHITDYEAWTEQDQMAAEQYVYGKPLMRPKAHSFVGSPSSVSMKSSQSVRPTRPSSTPDSSICSENEKSGLKREGMRSSWKSFFENNPITKKFGSSSKI